MIKPGHGLANGISPIPFGLAGKDLFALKLGHLQSATFERSGDVTYDGVVYGTNEPISVNGKYVHHGAISLTVPAYDVSPFTRPGTGSTDTAASAADPDKHGANLDLADVDNAWLLGLLDGKPEGPEIAGQNDSDWVYLSNASVDNGIITFTLENTTAIAEQSPSPLFVSGDRINLRYNVISNDDSRVIFASSSGFSASVPLKSDVGLREERILCTITNGKVRLALNQSTGIVIVGGISAKVVGPATGTLILNNINIVPTKTEWQTAGQLNILSGATGNQILYVDTDGFIKATDGTNTAVSPAEYVAGVDTDISLVFGGGNMQIVQDGTLGSTVSFVGTFSPGDTLKFAYENEDVMGIGSIAGKPYLSYSTASPAKGVISV